MSTQLIQLSDFRLPDYPSAQLNLDGAPLSIISTPENADPSNNTIITPAIGLATVLYNWHPNALAALLDLDAWFSTTWSLSINSRTSPNCKLEIGRIGNQITFGRLDSSGDNWTLMLTFNIVLEGASRGKWIPNPKESMLGETDITDAEEIERLGREFVAEIVSEKRWETGKGLRHRFFVEYAPMDVWGDGIPMSPHWLYEALDLEKCSACRTGKGPLNRCGKCGTATYCCAQCQRRDWNVHKDVCSMSMEERGTAIRITEKGGLIAWDEERLYAKEGEVSANPNLGEGMRKRTKMVGGSTV